MALYNATDGIHWYYNTNWGSTQPLNTWYGVDTDDNGRVTYLDLSWNQLSGSIPAELGNLEKLEELYLDNNALHGSIPSELGDLTNLKKIDIQNNKLSGPIPTSLGNLTNLQILLLWDNLLRGVIPSELGDLTNLKELNLGGNGLSGLIPSELGDLTNLKELILPDNWRRGGGFSGAIPASLGNLTNLEELDLSGSNLSGSIPTELGNLTNLETLDLQNNALSGSIPTELGNLTNLETLDLQNNALSSGPIPSSLGNLARLEVLHISYGEDARGSYGLSGQIPSEIGSLTNLRFLRLSGIHVFGPIPSWLMNLTNLESLELDGNNFTGSIPTELGNLTNLKTLNLWSNELSGSIPTELGNLTNLEYLVLGYNRLTGTVPAELGNLTNLSVLDLQSNRLTGTVPAELGNLTNLWRLDLGAGTRHNRLTGTIPAELGNLTSLGALDLGTNGLSGAVPTQFSSLINLYYIDLYGNGVCLPSGLNSWSLYSAVKSSGVPDCNASSQVPNKPDAPRVDAGNASLSLSWQAPGSDSAAVTSYDVQYKKSTDTEWATHAHTGAAVTASITGLDNNSLYEARIRATNSTGTGAWSNSAAATPQAPAAPNAPPLPTLIADDARILVVWGAPSDNRAVITDYDVQYRQGSSGSWVSQSHVGIAQMVTISGLNNNSEYQVQVRASNSAGTGAWSTAASATPKVPAAPSAPSAPTLTTHAYRIAVSWNAPADTDYYPNSDGFDYDVQYRPGSSGGWNWHYHQRRWATSTTISGLSGASYQVRVRASNSAGSGAWSTAASATPTGSASGPPTVTLSVSPDRISENSGTAVITATLSRTDTSDVSVTLDDFDVPLTLASGATKTISAGSTTATWSITATDDNINNLDHTELVNATASLSSTALSVVPTTLTLEDDEPSPTVNNVTHSGATLALGDYTGNNWWLKRTDPADTVCKSMGMTYVETLTGLTPDTDYTYEAYSDSNCTTYVTYFRFRTKELTTRTITDRTVTVELQNHDNRPWWIRQKIASTATVSAKTLFAVDAGPGHSARALGALAASPAAQGVPRTAQASAGAGCKPAGVNASTTLTGLRPSTSYSFGAYADSTCTTEIATISVTTAPASTYRPPVDRTVPDPPLTNYFIDDETLPRSVRYSINTIARAGITVGCKADPPRFCPNRHVTRAQMALFLQRAFKLPTPAVTDRFQDAEGYAQDAIAAIAQAGITTGCKADPPRFCPSRHVTRAQTAAFLVRALKLATPRTSAPFKDIHDHYFRYEITAIARAGIIAGCNADGTRFCPNQPVTRAQMAVFLARTLDFLARAREL